MSRTETVQKAARRKASAGATELTDLVARAVIQGARPTAREEIERDRKWVADADSTAQKMLRAGQSGGQLVGVMLTITIAAAIGFVGIKINSSVEDSITDKDLQNTDDVNQSVYENASESISGGFSDAMGLSDIVFLVLMFSVIMGVLLAFRARR